MLISTTREHFEPDVVAWQAALDWVAADDIATPLSTARYPEHTLRYASERRAELFSGLNRLALVRRHGPNPFERQLRAMEFANVRAANKFAPVVLP